MHGTQGERKDDGIKERTVSVEELVEVAGSFEETKAPVLDGIPNLAVKVQMSAHTEPLRGTYQRCMERRNFPKQWKRQIMLLIPKIRKKVGNPSVFRPVCSLDTLGG